MNISFVGQTSVLGHSARERRIQALASQFASQNHRVTAFSATERHIRKADGFLVQYTPSFAPDIPGGWVYTAISLLRALGKETDVVHVHGWHAAALLPFAALIHPSATFIWTVDTTPRNHRFARRAIVWIAARLCDAITTPTRALQYQVRLSYRVLAAYVPDGYVTPAAKDIAASHWKLRKGQYVLVVGEDTTALRNLCLAYKDTGKRKKLIILVAKVTAALKRLEKRYKFVRFIESTSARQRSSLIRQAERTLFLTNDSYEFLLAMDAGKPMLAANHPLLQELAGTTVQFFKADDRKYLVSLFNQPAPYARRKTKIRAQAHFTWGRVLEEYETLYHYPKVLRVPVDSIRKSRLVHGEVY